MWTMMTGPVGDSSKAVVVGSRVLGFAPLAEFVFYPKCNRQILNNLKW